MSSPELISVIDDDPSVLSSVCALLESHGWHLRSYKSAESFLHELDVDRVGCVVTDLRMPGMGGDELLTRLGGMESSLGVIVVTGHADVPSAVKIMESGAVTLLTKPYQPSELVAAVRTCLAMSQRRFEERARKERILRALANLNEDERQILDLLIQGQTKKSIVLELSLSGRTFDRRRQSLFEKMRVDSIPELATLMVSAGLYTG
jgi:two-component system response regulator FixJ